MSHSRLGRSAGARKGSRRLPFTQYWQRSAVRLVDEMNKAEEDTGNHGMDLKCRETYRGQSTHLRGQGMEKGGLGWLPFDCCVFITYTREIKRHIFDGAFMASLARGCV